MKIAIIITSLSTGGAQTMLLRMLERLDRRHFTPHIFCLASLGDIGPRIEALGFPVEALGMKPGGFNLFALARLVSRLKSLRPDVVHTWMYHADLLGGIAARLAHIRAVGWCIRNGDLDPGKTRFLTRLVVRVCALLSRYVPTRILCCSEAARQIHVALGYPASKMVVIPNGFDLAVFQPDSDAKVSLREELGLARNVLLIGLIGRYDPQKNHTGFFEAVGMLHERQPQVNFILAGEDIDTNNDTLMRSIQSAGIASVTHLLGPRSDIPRLMAALDLLVSASSYGESFPNVLGEAMACAVPCVTTDVGDSAHIVGDTGKVVPPGDMYGLSVAMEELLRLPLTERTVLGERARARVARHFEIGEVARCYTAFYQTLAWTGRA